MDKQNVVELMMEYYSARKKSKVLVHAIIQVKLKNMMLSEGSQIKKSHLVLVHLNDMSGMGKCMS